MRSAAFVTLSLIVSSAHAGLMLDDYEANRPMPFDSARGGGTATIVDGRLEVISGVSENFIQFLQAAGPERSGAVIDALSSGAAISLDVITESGSTSTDFNIQLIANTDAWVVDPGNNYRSIGQIYVTAASPGTQTLLAAPSGDLLGMLDNWKSGGGSYLEFFLDNTGWPPASNQRFYVDNVRVVPEPASLGLAGAVMLMSLRRR
jgi:hypothetical protein